MKKNIDIMSYILYHNFNNTLFDSEFSSELKEADISPAYKNEKKYQKKFTGQLVFYQMSLRYTKDQCSFRKTYSTQNFLIGLIEKCDEVFDKGNLSNFLMTGNSKAFNCTDHELLNAKRHPYRFYIISLTFIDSYLAERNKTSLKKTSHLVSGVRFEVYYGVPQGSILTPLSSH